MGKVLTKLRKKCSEKCRLETARTKSRVRGLYKFVYKYDLDASRLTDIVRASFIFPDITSLWEAVNVIDKEFAANGESDGGIRCMKDRMSHLTDSGYSDVLLNVVHTDEE